MFVKAIKKVEKAMFPIMRTIQTAPGQMEVGVSGTGFFINPNGLFVTVAHAFDFSPPNTSFQFAGHLPTFVQNPSLPIHEIARDNMNDIFVGKVDIDTPDYLSLSPDVADVGKTICIAGYPMPVIGTNNMGGIELSGVRRYYQPSFVLDHQRAVLNNNGMERVHEGILIRDFGLYGMSGGPVFDLDGTVVGMQGSVTNPRESTNGIQKIYVQNALAVNSSLIIQTLRAAGLH